MEWGTYVIQGIEILFLAIGTCFDVKNRELPFNFFVIFGLMGICCNLVWKYQSMKTILFGCSIGVVFLIIGGITKEEIGFGDALGFLVLGLFEGGKGVLCIAFLAFILSAVYGLYKMIVLGKSLKETMPFFPFLFLALIGVIAI